MKRVLLALALTIGFAATAVAQQKIGHIDVEELVAVMPETQTANAEIQKYQEQLEGDSQAMQEEYMTKMQNAQANVDTWTQLRLQKEQEELEAMGQRIMQFNQSAQQELQRKQMDLMLPIIEKAQEAINAVAKSNSFTYILDSSKGKAVVVFLENGEDIMPLVKAELGIQ
jgi:outer membrane protein